MLVLVIFLAVLLCMPVSVYTQDSPINKDSIVLNDKEEIFLNTKDGVFFIYTTILRDGSQELFVVKVDGKTGKIANSVKIDFKGMKPLHSKLTALVEDGRILLFSHVKANEGAKYLYMLESKDGGKTFTQTTVLNSQKDVLNPFAVAQAGSNIYAVWIDERIPKEFGIYLNYSNDNGVSFKDKDILLTEGFEVATLPTLIAEGNDVHFFFSGAGKDKPVGVYYRYSNDRGQKWSEPINVVKYEQSWQPSDIKAVRAKDGTLIVFWYGRGIHSAISKDGINWQEKVIFPSDGGDFVFNMDIKVNNNYIYMSASKGLLEYAYSKEKKPTIYFLLSSDNGTTWSQPEDIRKYQYSSTSAFHPQLAFNEGSKHAVLVWQDHRNIRGAIFVNYSEDGGLTWQNETFTIEDNPGKYHSFSPKMTSVNDDYYVVWNRARDDSRMAFDILIKKVNMKDLLKHKKERGGK